MFYIKVLEELFIGGNVNYEINDQTDRKFQFLVVTLERRGHFSNICLQKIIPFQCIKLLKTEIKLSNDF